MLAHRDQLELRLRKPHLQPRPGDSLQACLNQGGLQQDSLSNAVPPREQPLSVHLLCAKEFKVRKSH